MKKAAIYLLYLEILFNFLVISTAQAAFISSLEIQKKENIYRIIFQIRGELPESVNTKSLPIVTCQFSKLAVYSNLQMPQLPFGIVTNISFNPGSKGSIEIKVSDTEAHVEYLVLPTIPVKPGTYRLIFDVISSGKGVLPETKEAIKPETNETEKPTIPLPPPPTAPSQKEQSKVFPSKLIPFDEFIYMEAERAFKAKHYKRAWILFSRYLARGDKTHRGDALYQKAMAFYKMHQKEVKKYGFDMIQLFQDALTAFPAHKEAYNVKCLIGVLYHKLGVTKRAEKLLEELTSNSIPEDAQVCALKEIGKIKLEKELPIEALPIFSKVLQYKQNPKELADTYYLLGKTFYLAGSYQQAISNLYKALETYPLLYLIQPDVIRSIGNVLFGMKKYSLARWALVWYLNLASNPPHKDMLWAQIAETLFQDNKLRLAERLQNKIILEMPNTEGSYVTLLRKAQILEEKSKGALFEAEMIYEELAQKNLPEPLKGITYFRWALLKRKEGKLEEALKIIKEFITTASEKNPLDDFLELRTIIVREILDKKFQKKKYADFIKIYDKYQSDLNLDDTLLQMLVISFEHMKIYDQAFKYCEKLIKNSQNIDDTWYYKAASLSYLLGNLNKADKYALRIKNKNLEKQKLSILGKIATEKKDYRTAIKIFEKLFSMVKVPDKDITFMYIKCLQKLQKDAKIVKFVRSFLKNDSKLTKYERFELTKTMMQSLEKLGNFKEALKVAKKVIELAPDEDSRCQTLYIMSKLYEKQKDQKEMESCLQNMLSCKNAFWSKLAQGELNFLKFKKDVYKESTQ